MINKNINKYPTISVNRRFIEKNVKQWGLYEVRESRVDCGRPSQGQGRKKTLANETRHTQISPCTPGSAWPDISGLPVLRGKGI